jgi:CRP/FNR family transcriptional regulator
MRSMPNGEETARLLAQVEVFAGLEPKELEQVAQVAVPRSYERGEVIFREGDSGDTCYVVKSGSVSVMREHQDGRVIALAELRPGQIFGELAMFDHETRSATVETLEPTTTVALLAGDLQRILRAHPEMGVKMLAALASRLRRANERLLQQSFQTVAGRVASALLTQVIARQAEGAPEVDVLVRATQAEIAQLAGTSRESASRFLATLEREGVVSLGRGKTTVHEPSRLRNYIH